jgi:Fe2+ or Zn2+ uptake regulation protein
MELPETITCTKCGEIKPLTSEYFIPNSGYKFGFTRWCKVCSSKHNEICREENSVIETDMNTDLVKELMEKPVSFTLMGLPVRIDEKMSPSQISLYEGEREVVRIENLAIPCGFAVE